MTAKEAAALFGQAAGGKGWYCLLYTSMPGGAASASEHFSGRGSYDGVRSHPAVPVSGASQESGGRTGGFLLLDLGRLFHLFVSVP